MKTLPSHEFRIVYAKLTEPTDVTAYGRLIGTWLPAVVKRNEPLTREQARQMIERPKRG